MFLLAYLLCTFLFLTQNYDIVDAVSADTFTMSRPADIVIVLEIQLDYPEATLRKQLPSLANLLENINVSREGAHVTFVTDIPETYNQTIYNFTETMNSSDIHDIVMNTPQHNITRVDLDKTDFFDKRENNYRPKASHNIIYIHDWFNWERKRTNNKSYFQSFSELVQKGINFIPIFLISNYQNVTLTSVLDLQDELNKNLTDGREPIKFYFLDETELFNNADLKEAVVELSSPCQQQVTIGDCTWDTGLCKRKFKMGERFPGSRSCQIGYISQNETLCALSHVTNQSNHDSSIAFLSRRPLAEFDQRLQRHLSVSPSADLTSCLENTLVNMFCDVYCKIISIYLDTISNESVTIKSTNNSTIETTSAVWNVTITNIGTKPPSYSVNTTIAISDIAENATKSSINESTASIITVETNLTTISYSTNDSTIETTTTVWNVTSTNSNTQFPRNSVNTTVTISDTVENATKSSINESTASIVTVETNLTTISYSTNDSTIETTTTVWNVTSTNNNTQFPSYNVNTSVTISDIIENATKCSISETCASVVTVETNFTTISYEINNTFASSSTISDNFNYSVNNSSNPAEIDCYLIRFSNNKSKEFISNMTNFTDLSADYSNNTLQYENDAMFCSNLTIMEYCKPWFVKRHLKLVDFCPENFHPEECKLPINRQRCIDVGVKFTAQSSSSNTDQHEPKLNLTYIVIGVVCGIVLLLAAVILIIKWDKHRRRSGMATINNKGCETREPMTNETSLPMQTFNDYDN